MAPPAEPSHRTAMLSALDARVLRELPMATASGSRPAVEEVAVRFGAAVDVARRSLRRLTGGYLAEHDGGRPRRWARTGCAEHALEGGP